MVIVKNCLSVTKESRTDCAANKKPRITPSVTLPLRDPQISRPSPPCPPSPVMMPSGPPCCPPPAGCEGATGRAIGDAACQGRVLPRPLSLSPTR